MLLNPLTLHLPKSRGEAAKLFKELEDVKIHAGGTFLLNSLKLFKNKGTKTPAHILSLAKVDDLKGIAVAGDRLTINAMTTIAELFDSGAVQEFCPVLHAVCRNISTQPIRNMATVGGNLTCRYTWTEMGAVMIALDAVLHFLMPDGTEVPVPAEDFFKNAARSEYLFTHVTIPLDPASKTAYRRVKKTLHVDVPLLAVCVKTTLAGGRWGKTRVGVNSGTAFAQRDYALEKFLDASECAQGLGEMAMGQLTADIYDLRSTDYKQHMFRVSLRQAIDDICAAGRQAGGA